MKKLFDEYGSFIISALITVFVIFLLFFFLNADTLIGVQTEVNGDLKVDTVAYNLPYTFEASSCEINNGMPFEWQDYVTAYDENGDSLLDNVLPSGSVDTNTDGVYLMTYTLYYKGRHETIYAAYNVKTPTLIGPYTKLSINNGEKAVYVIKNFSDTTRYLVIEANSIGKFTFNNTLNNNYFGSSIDTYLNETYFNSLSTKLQDAIYSNYEINQKFYKHLAVQDLCPDNPNDNISSETPHVGDYGRHPFSYDFEVVNTGDVYERKVFLASTNEIAEMVNLDNWNDTRNFLNGNSILLTRDGWNSINMSMTIGTGSGSPFGTLVSTSCDVRPAYVLDLSLIDWEIIS